ncbi:MAG TPA: tetratricopeptide repeat protein [Nitrospiria bacterium]|nr:tetratricopeptide repeat protein [Nitrospiria bacterium]
MTNSEEWMDEVMEEATGTAVGSTPQSTTAELAIAYAKERRYDDALRYFQKAAELSLEARSYYGLSLAMRRQRLADAVRYCREAVDRDPMRGEWYLNLGHVYLACGEKRRAVRAFCRGLLVQPRHPRLTEALSRMGMRKQPAIPFLSRSHPVNKYLGLIRHRISQGS